MTDAPAPPPGLVGDGPTVEVVILPFRRRMAGPAAQELHFTTPDGERSGHEAICGFKSTVWQPPIDGLRLCDPCRLECLRRLRMRSDGGADWHRSGWEPDMSKTCPQCGCKSVVVETGTCGICGGQKGTRTP